MLVSVCCFRCGKAFEYEKFGRGRLRRFCSDDCRRQQRYEHSNSKYSLLTREQRTEYNLKGRRLTCALCNEPMFKGGTSKPQGEAMHNECIKQVTSLKYKLIAIAKALEAMRHDATEPVVEKKPKPRRLLPSNQRGYDHRHRMLRKRWAKAVALDIVDCWRCGEHIAPDQPWDLGHDDHDRSIHRGPECRPCNRSGLSRRSPRWIPCAICGTPFKRQHSVKTCGRACGGELRRRNRELRAAG